MFLTSLAFSKPKCFEKTKLSQVIIAQAGPLGDENAEHVERSNDQVEDEFLELEVPYQELEPEHLKL